MQELLGQKLLKEKAVTEEQLQQAIERQRLYGSRLGDNLVALGYLAPEYLDTFFRRHPKAPATVKETGLELSFIADLIMKHILFMGEFNLTDVSEEVKLPVPVVDEAMEVLRRDKFVEVKGAAGYAKVTYRFNITGPGRNRAAELLDVCRYAGPAPVLLEQYNSMVELQTVKHIIASEQSVHEAFAYLVISEKQLRRIGPAISSGKAIFLYGPPETGRPL